MGRGPWVEIVTSEPRVEELLATIRRAIDRDINELDARELPTVPKLRGSLLQDAPNISRRPERDADSNIASLRMRVQRQKLETPAPGPVPQRVLRPSPSLYQPLAEPEPVVARYEEAYPPEPVPYFDPHAAHWPEPEPTAEPEPDEQPHYAPLAPIPDPLMSQEASYAAQASFQALTNAMMSQLGGDTGLQERARELLRPMLKSWLDQNLPTLVERMVRDEIERVARRGR